jgi:hypothetical protein
MRGLVGTDCGVITLVQAVREYRAAPKVFLERHPHPWLLWSTGKLGADSMSDTMGNAVTGPGVASRTPSAGQPVLLPVVRRPGSNFELGVTVGRGPTNDVIIASDQVSRFHCYIVQKEDTYFLVDANSMNGTKVNGEILKPLVAHILPVGAKVGLGGLGVEFCLSTIFSDP